jgi:L-asparaginase/Glu-tRNA(Gln) amidotransferase subunit D
MVDDREWRDLCEKASKEMNPERLLQLIERINRLFAEREKDLRKNRSPPSGTAS